MKIYCLKNVALLARKRQLVIDLMSHVLLDEVVGEPLQGKVPELHPSGAPELTHGVYSGSCYVIFSFLCSDCSFVPFFWSLYSLSFFDLRFSIIPQCFVRRGCR
jgi:hypothetical protein